MDGGAMGSRSPCGLEESDTTERLRFHFSLSCTGEGNDNPLQCSCLENPRDGGAWWAAVYGVAQSRTRLKQVKQQQRKFQHKYQTSPDRRTVQPRSSGALTSPRRPPLANTGQSSWIGASFFSPRVDSSDISQRSSAVPALSIRFPSSFFGFTFQTHCFHASLTVESASWGNTR